MMRLAAVDFNGCLVADTKLIITISNAIIEKYGGTRLLPAQYVDEFTYPALDFFNKRGCSGLDRQTLAHELHELYAQKAPRIRTRKGARQFLQWANEHSIDVVILSNHTENGIYAQLIRLGLHEYVNAVLGISAAEDTLDGYGKADRMSAYLHENSVSNDEALIVGDSPYDIEAGKALGIKTAGITGGMFSERRLIEAKPNYLIRSFHQLREIMEKPGDCNEFY